MLHPRALQDFERDGYCKIEGLLKPRDFAPVMGACARVLDQLCAQLKNGGRIKDTHAGLPFLERYLQITRDTGGVFAQHFTIALPQQGVTADTPILLAPEVFNLLVHPRIMDAVEHFLGPEIAVSPVGNVHIKPPENLIASGQHRQRVGLFRATPWHQDNGVMTPDADRTPMLTVWFSITDVPLECGCLQVIPGSHHGRILRHCPDHNGELSIPASMLPAPRPRPLPMRAGDVLFLHRRLCHAALANRSSRMRWSFDLRYIPAGPAAASCFRLSWHAAALHRKANFARRQDGRKCGGTRAPGWPATPRRAKTGTAGAPTRRVALDRQSRSPIG